ncbi:unnamed protein product [Caenorhabditis bovis]|uniref:Uncharacterized protein n=1 Tax=Caenorhabditis bovis TaxID=2654633 RepID=A0A8S1EDZ2_9PELO|nr:unnamed protein product [Caenorhabditis bovis]
MTSKTPSEEKSSESEGSPQASGQLNTTRTFFNSSSELSSRSNSSTPRRTRQTTSSSGFGSLSHLPPLHYKKSADLMSQSLCVQSSKESQIGYRRSLSKSRNFFDDPLETWTPSSPSLMTLRDFMATNDTNVIDDDDMDYEFDNDDDDVKSVVSSASTSRLFSMDRKFNHKKQSLRMFLNSPALFSAIVILWACIVCSPVDTDDHTIFFIVHARLLTLTTNAGVTLAEFSDPAYCAASC